MPWYKKNFSEFLPSVITESADNISQAIDLISTYLNSAKIAAQAAQIYVNGIPDLVQTYLDYLEKNTLGFISDLENYGVYTIFVPPMYSKTQFINTLLQSLDDTGDFNRPIFEVTDLTVMVFLANASSMEELFNFVNSVDILFNVKSWLPPSEKMTNVLLPPDGLSTERIGNTIKISWNSARIRNVLGYNIYKSKVRGGEDRFTEDGEWKLIRSGWYKKIGFTNFNAYVDTDIESDILDGRSPVPPSNYYVVTTVTEDGRESDASYEVAGELYLGQSMVGVPPNWLSLSIKNTLPFMELITDALYKLATPLLGVGTTAQQGVDLLVSIIDDKLTELNYVLTKMQHLLNAISNLKGSASIYVEDNVKGTDGIKYVFDSMLEKRDAPPNEERMYFTCVVLVAPQSAGEVLKSIFGV